MNFILILTSVLLNCFAQVFMRKGMLLVGSMSISMIFKNAYALLTNFWLWIAMLCYAVSVVLWMVVLSKVEVSYAYPLSSVGFVVAAILG